MKNLFNFVVYVLAFLFPYSIYENETTIKSNEAFHIYIPKIKVSNNIYDYDDKKNNVNQNIYNATKYNFSKLNGSLVLASHSGNSSVSYFNDIDKLSLGDEIFIEDKDNIYLYLVNKIFFIDKTGMFYYDNKDKYIYMITCVKNSHKKQLVIGGYLSKITKKSTFS